MWKHVQTKGQQSWSHMPESTFDFPVGQRTKRQPRRHTNWQVIVEDMRGKLFKSHGLILTEAGVHKFDLSASTNQAIERRLK